jgi:hypothetical protein
VSYLPPSAYPLLISPYQSSPAQTECGYVAHRLSHDHTADDPSEQERIKAAGGFITRGRVLGILAVSRSFGDHGMKEYVTALPHLTEVKLSERGSCPFMILACDGLWDVMTDQEAVEMVLEEMKSNGPQEGIAEILVSPATLDRALGSSNDRTRWRQPLIAAQVIMSLQLSSIFRRESTDR